MITRTVTPSESGKKLHRYVRQLLPNCPLGQIYKMIDQGKVKVNGKRKNQNYELSAGDELHFYLEEEAFRTASGGEESKPRKFAGVKADIDVVYEDHELLIVNKPAGLLTHPDQSEHKNTLITRVHAYLHQKNELDSRLFLPATANRLDRNTSGLVIIGKTAGMLHQVNQWIQKRELHKTYVTIVHGQLHGSGTLRNRVVRAESGNRTTIVSENSEEEGKEAVTHYRSLASGNGATLVEVELESGRTHQIRLHFQSIGHSLIGDLKYGGRMVGSLNHQLLHAYRLSLPDGRSFAAIPPEPFRAMMKRLDIPLAAIPLEPL